MKLLLVCSAGMSTSLLEKAINDSFKKQNIEGICHAMGSELAREKYNDFDIILLGPQVRFMQKQFQDLVENKKPVIILDSFLFATANGEKIIEVCKDLLKK